MKRSHLLFAAVAVCATLVVTSYASPYWTLHRMKIAIAEKDADRFSGYVDFPALRDSVKGQMMVMMNKRMTAPDMENNPFAGLGQIMGAALINPMVDATISPAGVIAMFESGRAQPAQPQSSEPASPASAVAPNFVVKYENWRKVAISRVGDDGRFILKRTGLWSWQLTALELPKSVLDSSN